MTDRPDFSDIPDLPRFPAHDIRHALAAAGAADPAEFDRKRCQIRPFAAGPYAAFLQNLAGWGDFDTAQPGTDRPHAAEDMLTACDSLVYVFRHAGTVVPAFAFTATAEPFGATDPGLAASQTRVARIADGLGLETALLLQHLPFFQLQAGAPPSSTAPAAQAVIFGGWLRHAGSWTPFVLSPGGIGDAIAQREVYTAKAPPPGVFAGRGQDRTAALAGIASIHARLDAHLLGEAAGTDYTTAGVADGWSMLVDRRLLELLPARR